MQCIYENYTFPVDQSFSISAEPFEIKKHHTLKSHANFEITLLENCSGKRFIGDHIQNFEGTELVILGSNLPHCWQCDKQPDPMSPPQRTVIRFFPDFLGKQLLEKPEAKQLSELFCKASKGILFTGSTIKKAKKVMREMLVETGMARVALMLRLLDILAQSDTSQVLSSPYFNSIESSSEAQKINKVYDYIFRNFKKDISLQEVADLIPMSPAAFCRFFKAKTNRTLIDFVKEVRISYAAKLLLKGGHNITECCYNSGYNNISNFNKHFKESKGLSPRDFLNQYRMPETENTKKMQVA
ncbi:AraC family transcriptional regulator [Solitalea koreensis]|uniref:Transcriptional regulator, AraC family n=1 Tax=Solitalea koreensis TaxID=543615 RepID=A0A521DM43_9SPHI|nr:AraC family transcriptional regulator [Solitalea koreensis]SMO72010.1 transcriptional regulator, AraC family [Solitalea koreensis]